jgi:oligoribonuclease (3'-5' exoribonuclease)
MGNKGYKVNPNLLFWVRLKTLHSNNDINRILEIAYIYTDMKLTACQYGLHFVIQCDKEQLETAG